MKLTVLELNRNRFAHQLGDSFLRWPGKGVNYRKSHVLNLSGKTISKGKERPPLGVASVLMWPRLHDSSLDRGTDQVASVAATAAFLSLFCFLCNLQAKST